MEYFLIIVLQLLGIGFHVMQKVISLGDLYPEKTIRQIFEAFFKADWDTLTVSGLVLITHFTFHFILTYYNPELTNASFTVPVFGGIIVSYVIVSFVIAFVLGYAGQRLAYKWLGSAEKKLENKI